MTTPGPEAGSVAGPGDAAASFEPHRRFLVGLAYRMLGSVAEAEDVAQDAYLRWHGADRSAVAEPRAFLARTASRLCLDRMKSATAQREHYVGTWLPEPLIEPASDPRAAAPGDPAGALVLAEDVSIALLLTLERLSPLERAAFLLHDVLDFGYAEIAEVLERSEAACRQLVARGRDHVRTERPRFTTTPDATARLAGAFHAAMLGGDLSEVTRLLADDAVFYSDGGGKRTAALQPIYGKDKIVRFLFALENKGKLPQAPRIELVSINGAPGFVVRHGDEVETLALEVSGDHVAAIYAVRNPDKLRHLR
jgi:RNA polymerase sigma-70 factor (ECF subfamily)